MKKKILIPFVKYTVFGFTSGGIINCLRWTTDANHNIGKINYPTKEAQKQVDEIQRYTSKLNNKLGRMKLYKPI